MSLPLPKIVIGENKTSLTVTGGGDIFKNTHIKLRVIGGNGTPITYAPTQVCEGINPADGGTIDLTKIKWDKQILQDQSATIEVWCADINDEHTVSSVWKEQYPVKKEPALPKSETNTLPPAKSKGIMWWKIVTIGIIALALIALAVLGAKKFVNSKSERADAKQVAEDKSASIASTPTNEVSRAHAPSKPSAGKTLGSPSTDAQSVITEQKLAEALALLQRLQSTNGTTVHIGEKSHDFVVNNGIIIGNIYTDSKKGKGVELRPSDVDANETSPQEQRIRTIHVPQELGQGTEQFTLDQDQFLIIELDPDWAVMVSASGTKGLFANKIDQKNIRSEMPVCSRTTNLRQVSYYLEKTAQPITLEVTPYQYQ
jgi:hypothetical protein